MSDEDHADGVLPDEPLLPQIPRLVRACHRRGEEQQAGHPKRIARMAYL